MTEICLYEEKYIVVAFRCQKINQVLSWYLYYGKARNVFQLMNLFSSVHGIRSRNEPTLQVYYCHILAICCILQKRESVFGNEAYQNKSLFLRNWTCFLTRRFFIYFLPGFGSSCLAGSHSQIPSVEGSKSRPKSVMLVPQTPVPSPVSRVMSQSMRIPDMHFLHSYVTTNLKKKCCTYYKFTLFQGWQHGTSSLWQEHQNTSVKRNV